MELEKLSVRVEAEADTSELERMKQQLKELQSLYSKWTSLANNGNTVAENMFGNDAARKVQQLKDEIGLLANEIKELDTTPTNQMGESLKNMTSSFSGDGLKSVVKSVSKIGVAMLGVRSIFSSISKAMNSYLAQNDQLQAKLNGLWYALGSMFAPILEYIINLFAKIIGYVNVLVKALGFAGINMSNLNKNAKQAKQSLSGIDEINNISQQSGNMATDPLQDVQLDTKWVETIQNIATILEPVIQLVRDAWELIQDILEYLVDPSWENFKALLSDFNDIIIDSLEFSNNLFDGIAEGFDNLLAGIEEGVIETFGEDSIITMILNSSMEAFRSNLKRIKEDIDLFFGGFKTVFVEIGKFLNGDVTASWTNFINGLLDVVEGFINAVIDASIVLFTGSVFDAIIAMGNMAGFDMSALESIRDSAHITLPRLEQPTNTGIIANGNVGMNAPWTYEAMQQNKAEELTQLAEINENLTRIYGKNFSIELDGDNLAKNVNNRINENAIRNGYNVFALER